MMTPEQALEVAASLIDQIELAMMCAADDPGELERLKAELLDARRLHAQTLRRVEAKRARLVEDERRAEAVEQALSREQLWTTWNSSIRFLSRRSLTPALKSRIIQRYELRNYRRLPP